MNVDPQYGFLALAGALAIAYLIAKFLWKVDGKIEARRRVAFQVAADLKAKGLTFLPILLEDYAVGDYSGMAIQMEKIAVVLTHDPKAVDKEFEIAFLKILMAKLSTPEGRAQVVAIVTPPAAAKAPAA